MPKKRNCAGDQPSEPAWTAAQQRFLALLQQEGFTFTSVRDLCKRVGYHTHGPWYDALKDARFAQTVEVFLGFSPTSSLSPTQQRLLQVLQHEENRSKSAAEICRLARCHEGNWRVAMRKKQFAEAVEALGVKPRQLLPAHVDVILTPHPEEVLAQDTWDMRRLKSEYPKHVAPSKYIVDFSWIANPLLREQVKRYFRQRLPQWKAGTFRHNLKKMKPFLESLPPDIHIGTLERHHVDAALPKIWSLGQVAPSAYLREIRSMLEYMALSPAWPGPRPPRNLIWKEDIPSRPIRFLAPFP